MQFYVHKLPEESAGWGVGWGFTKWVMVFKSIIIITPYVILIYIWLIIRLFLIYIYNLYLANYYTF